MLSKLKMPRLQNIGIPFHDADSMGDAVLTLIIALSLAFFALQLAMLGHGGPHL
jgi:hypothetical protein